MKAMASSCFSRHHRQRGLTMIELLIAMTLGLFIVLSATGLLLSSKAGYIVQDQTAHVQETGRYAMEVLSRAIRQAGHENLSDEDSLVTSATEVSANVIGMDAVTLRKNTAGLDAADSKGAVNGSDVLALRFFGDETGEGDGTILNCAGLAVASPAANESAEHGRGWSIFFVADDAGGEPELRCKYKTKTGWNADAIARGVESFQVLYGVDADDDGLPDRFVNADTVDALDGQLALVGENAAARAIDLNRQTHWKKIRSIQLAMLVRGTQSARDDAMTIEYRLFGTAYASTHAAKDDGTHIREQSIRSAERNRLRKVFTQTIQLRNDPAGSSI